MKSPQIVSNLLQVDFFFFFFFFFMTWVQIFHRLVAMIIIPEWLQPGDVLAWTSIHTPSNHENLNGACMYNVIIIWITASDWREWERGGGLPYSRILQLASVLVYWLKDHKLQAMLGNTENDANKII